MTQPKRSSNRWLQWDEAARVYEALGKADPDLVLFRKTKFEVPIGVAVLYCYLLHCAGDNV